MSEAALVKTIERILSGNYDPVAAIVKGEQERGFKVIRPGDTPWFRANDWRAASVASINASCARLILLHAFESGKGAFTRTIDGVRHAGLTPAVIDPTAEFAAALKRRGWKGRLVGSSFEDRESVWRPRRK